MLKAHVALHEGPLAVDLVKKMRALRLRVTHVTYSEMLLAFCKAGNVQVCMMQKWHHMLLPSPALPNHSLMLSLTFMYDYCSAGHDANHVQPYAYCVQSGMYDINQVPSQG